MHSSSPIIEEKKEETKTPRKLSIFSNEGKSLKVANKMLSNKNENQTTEDGISDNDNKSERRIYKLSRNKVKSNEKALNNGEINDTFKDNSNYLKPTVEKTKIGVYQDDAMTHENSLASDFIFDKQTTPNELVTEEKKISKKKKKVKKDRKKSKRIKNPKSIIEKQKNTADDRFDNLTNEQRQRVVNRTIDAVLLKLQQGRYSYHGYALNNEGRSVPNRDR